MRAWLMRSISASCGEGGVGDEIRQRHEAVTGPHAQRIKGRKKRAPPRESGTRISISSSEVGTRMVSSRMPRVTSCTIRAHGRHVCAEPGRGLDVHGRSASDAGQGQGVFLQGQTVEIVVVGPRGARGLQQLVPVVARQAQA